jgi:hypothetical protein
MRTTKDQVFVGLIREIGHLPDSTGKLDPQRVARWADENPGNAAYRYFAPWDINDDGSVEFLADKVARLEDYAMRRAAKAIYEYMAARAASENIAHECSEDFYHDALQKGFRTFRGAIVDPWREKPVIKDEQNYEFFRCWRWE